MCKRWLRQRYPPRREWELDRSLFTIRFIYRQWAILSPFPLSLVNSRHFLVPNHLASFDSLSLNRYPSPTHDDVKQLLCKLRKVPSPANFFLGVGSDEAIDLLFRITCIPGKDKVLVCPPTYGMYSVCAQINDVEVVKVPLDVEGGKFLPNVDEVSQKLFPLRLTHLTLNRCDRSIERYQKQLKLRILSNSLSSVLRETQPELSSPFPQSDKSFRTQIIKD